MPSQTSWKLDGVGNWLQVNGQSQTFSSTNELVQSAAAAGGPATVTYDNNGNQTDDGTYLYAYDAMNRLIGVTLKSSGELIASYSYDAFGRRTQTIVTNSGSLDGTTEYDYDGQQDIQEQNGSGTLTQQYVYGAGINEVLVMDRNLTGGSTATGPGDQRLFYYQNALGSVMALTDTSARILEADEYDAYGRQTKYRPGTERHAVDFGSGDVVTPRRASEIGNPFLFTGQRLSTPRTGMYYYRARYYNPLQGRFIQRDPAGYGDSMDVYTYVQDSPTNATDPTGYAAEWSRKLVQGPDKLDNGKPDYEVKIAHVLPDVPKGATQFWQVVKIAKSWVEDDCKVVKKTSYILDIVNIANRTEINDKLSWTVNAKVCFAVEQCTHTVGFDDQKSKYAQQTSVSATEKLANTLLDTMAGPERDIHYGIRLQEYERLQVLRLVPAAHTGAVRRPRAAGVRRHQGRRIPLRRRGGS